MRARRLTVVAIAAAFAGPLVLFSAQARADDTTQSSLESGHWAKPLTRVAPKYPKREAQKGVEGWVDVSFVISPKGIVDEVIIDASSGREAFEKETLRSVRKWRYEPATLDGKPVEQCHTKVRIVYALEQRRLKRGARMRFKKEYAKASAFLEQGQLEKATATIDKIEQEHVTTLYESARVWMLRSMVNEKEGDALKQLSSLSRAASGSKIYIEPSIKIAVFSKILGLELDFKHYADALDTIERLAELDLDDGMAQKLDKLKIEIEATRVDERVIAIDATIGEAREEHDNAGTWRHTLLRRTVGIEEISGSLERVELRCTWHRVKAKPEKGRAWRIPPEWGDCSIYVFGEPGSTFQLLEYSSTAS